MNNWPSETMIDLVAHNGECDQPVYKIDGTLYRINPAGKYALYWSGKKWMESAMFTNIFVKSVGEVVL